MIIALAGHVDHGKTALIRALTGIDADRLPEEKKRGMTIDLGFAHVRMPSGAMVGFVDVPGHERFLSNMLAGVLSIDTVLLVIAADDGPMPQTREHLAILRLTGVSDITAVISKIDRVDGARLDAARAAARDVLDDAGYAGAPVMEASSVTGDGIAAVLAHIESKAAAHRARDASGGFRLAIDRSFSPPGAGLVVTGTVASGIVSVGDRLLLSPSRLAARVRGIQVHNEVATTARAGDRCALAIAGPRIERARLKRGDWLIDPSLHAPTQRIDALVRAIEDRGARHAARVHVHFGAASVTGRVLMRQGGDLRAGRGGVRHHRAGPAERLPARRPVDLARQFHRTGGGGRACRRSVLARPAGAAGVARGIARRRMRSPIRTIRFARCWRRKVGPICGASGMARNLPADFAAGD